MSKPYGKKKPRRPKILKAEARQATEQETNAVLLMLRAYLSKRCATLDMALDRAVAETNREKEFFIAGAVEELEAKARRSGG